MKLSAVLGVATCAIYASALVLRPPPRYGISRVEDEDSGNEADDEASGDEKEKLTS